MRSIDTWRRFGADRRGTVAVLSAVLITTILGIAAVGVDLGSVYLDRRKAQSIADLAALAAVSDITNADTMASKTVAANAPPSGTTYVLQLGAYTPNASLTPAQRFTTSAGGSPNAARVTLTTSTPLHFAKIVTGKDKFEIDTTATAAVTQFGAFAIGSRLASLNGGLLNQVLGGLIGTNLSLSVMDYNALLSAKLDMFQFMGALATRLSLTGVTYDSILSSSVSVGKLTGAMLDTEKAAYGLNSDVVAALQEIDNAAQGLSTKIPVRSVLDLGPYDGLTVGQTPKVGVSASALDMVSAIAEMANQQHQIQMALNLNVPGIASASLQLAVGERPQGTSWFTVGATGASVHTAQTRLLLTAKLGGSGVIPSVTVPVYIELASATATLDAVTCGLRDSSATSATIGVTPAVIDAWIGAVSNSDFTNFRTAPNPPAATLVSAPLVTVTGRSHVTVTNLDPTEVTFTQSDIDNGVRKTVGTTDYTSSLLTKLFSDTQLNATVVGVNLGLPQVATSTVGTILGTATSPIDQLLSTVLDTLGVGIGEADVWVTGVRCDGAVLVN